MCISIPRAELENITTIAERVQMSRSHFLRAAAKHFAAFIEGPTKSGEQVTSG